MKTILFIILLTTSTVLFAQKNAIKMLSEIQKENPTKAIFYADSLLLTNTSKKNNKLIKYYQN